MIEYCSDKIRVVIDGIYLPKTSPAYKPWRNQLKLLCMERLNRIPHDRDYSLSATFSANAKIRDKIKAEFLDLIKKSQALTEGTKLEDTYQMSFDLFSWTGEQFL
jgi:hypothetical protein